MALQTLICLIGICCYFKKNKYINDTCFEKFETSQMLGFYVG